MREKKTGHTDWYQRSKHIFRKLRFQFIVVASIAVTIILVAFVGVVNSVNYLQGQGELDSVSNILIEDILSRASSSKIEQHLNDIHLNRISPSNLHYFHFYYNEDNEIVSSDVSHDPSIKNNALPDILERIPTDQESGSIRYQSILYSYQKSRLDLWRL